jgi:uncharacterized protein (DUF1330 family)
VKTNHKLTLAVLAGVSIGLAAAQAIHAQQAKVPPTYVIAEVEKDPTKIENPAASRRYAEEAPKSLAAFQAQYLVRGGKIQTLEGEAPKGYIVVIGFESVEKRVGGTTRLPMRRSSPLGKTQRRAAYLSSKASPLSKRDRSTSQPTFRASRA